MSYINKFKYFFNNLTIYNSTFYNFIVNFLLHKYFCISMHYFVIIYEAKMCCLRTSSISTQNFFLS